MKAKLIIGKNEVIIRLYDNSATRELLKNLPIDLAFKDYAGKEKISYFPKPLSLNNNTTGAVPVKGEVTIFKPWGNLAIFYKDHGSSPDGSLIPIGTVEKGLKYLETEQSDFNARLEETHE